MLPLATDKQSLTNEWVALALEDVADLLEAQGANPFRVRAYRNGAETVRGLRRSIQQIVQYEGVDALLRLPGIGRSLSHAIDHLVRSGRWPLLERLRGDDAAERIFATVPDIGSVLARRIHEHLGIETLGELEVAANDGRLEQVPGMGLKRIRAVRESIAGRFSQVSHKPFHQPQPMTQQPSIEELLDIDEEYRRLSKQGKLPRITPRRFNPTNAAWLPVLHTQRGDRHYTALFSNTERAHELGMTHDWVVIYRDDNNDHGRWTVITAQYGRVRGHRVVLGREVECATHHKEPVISA